MYLRPVHSTYHLPTIYAFIRKHALGVLTSFLPKTGTTEIQTSHIPWVLDVPEDISEFLEKDEGKHDKDPQKCDAFTLAAEGKTLAVLRGHMARANPQAQVFIAAAKSHVAACYEESEQAAALEKGITLPNEVLVLFNGPTEHYVTPKFYTTTKPSTGKVVPTWDYEAVQVYGRITVYPSTTSSTATGYLTAAITDLTRVAEMSQGYDGQEGRPEAWEVEDAPGKYIDILKKAIVGVSIEVTRMGGKFKMSQEVSEADRQGVIQGFEELGEPNVANSVARWSQKE